MDLHSSGIGIQRATTRVPTPYSTAPALTKSSGIGTQRATTRVPTPYSTAPALTKKRGLFAGSFRSNCVEYIRILVGRLPQYAFQGRRKWMSWKHSLDNKLKKRTIK